MGISNYLVKVVNLPAVTYLIPITLYIQEVSSDTDLSYLERRRLEDEFRKLKELKRKAEQYAIEAKQTAQRLSAENSKLRDDLSRERRHNELTRTNIIREFEEKVSSEAMAAEKMATKMEFYDQEIKEKAKLLQRRHQGEVNVKRGMCTTEILPVRAVERKRSKKNVVLAN